MVLLPDCQRSSGISCVLLAVRFLEAEWAGPWLAVAFAAFYLLLLRLPAAGRWRESPQCLSSLHLTVGGGISNHRNSAQGARPVVHHWMARRGRGAPVGSNRVRSKLLRVLALLCLLLGLMALVAVNPDASTTPFLNERFGTYCVAVAVFVFVAWLARQAPPEERQPG